MKLLAIIAWCALAALALGLFFAGLYEPLKKLEGWLKKKIKEIEDEE